MFKTSIRMHAYILLFPFFTGISVTEATAQTVSQPEPCRHIGNTEACVMTEDDAMTDSSHTADEPSADMKIPYGGVSAGVTSDARPGNNHDDAEKHTHNILYEQQHILCLHRIRTHHEQATHGRRREGQSKKRLVLAVRL